MTVETFGSETQKRIATSAGDRHASAAVSWSLSRPPWNFRMFSWLRIRLRRSPSTKAWSSPKRPERKPRLRGAREMTPTPAALARAKASSGPCWRMLYSICMTSGRPPETASSHSGRVFSETPQCLILPWALKSSSRPKQSSALRLSTVG
ncbi:MAG: hypothetical protein QGG90_02910, partial [Nitrospinota bacterium]|nr:hypothetical protein [Nitrospinota bacterium]